MLLLQGGFVDVRSCAAQLTQTANHAMQLPYSILGMGMAPNFIDFMTVHVTNASADSRSHEWPQIIPNSQVSLIHPVNLDLTRTALTMGH